MSKTRQKSYEIEMNSKARRAQGGLGLLSHTISVQSLQESIPKILSLEKEGGREERSRRRRDPGRRGGVLFWPGAPGREERVRGI